MSDNITHREAVFPAGWAKKCVDDAVEALSCPQCGSPDVCSYDYETDTDTGYRDAGLVCNDCGEVF